MPAGRAEKHTKKLALLCLFCVMVIDFLLSHVSSRVYLILSFHCSLSCYISICSQSSGDLFVLPNQETLPHIGHVSRDVELCTWVEVILSTGYRGTQSLVLHPAMQ